MKNLKSLALIVTMAAVPVFLSNCGDTETVDPSPVLEFIGGGDYISGDVSLPTGTDFEVGINASHESNIESLKITVSYDGGAALTPAGCTLCDTAFSAKTLRVDFVGTTGNSVGEEKWSFTIADKDGNSTTKTITIDVLASGDDLFVFEMDNSNPPQPHRVWNFIGPNKGAHQMGAGSVGSSDPNAWKDIQDSITIAEGSNWPGRWGSRNGATYKKITGYSWVNMANTAQLEQAWNDAAGSGTATITPAKDEFYAIKLTNGKYAFIEITDVVSTPSDNLDYIQFRYKYRN
ncbi:MAG: hypothetical protein JXR19_04310 [Bacteroidia bacterium]